ncbi:MAG: hypothetical protein ACR2PX_11950 [Endozoicomonas sp.]|uniref:hypothetical protein n=1 Tax=Endozoicomonas sp. TaxID=1892382 RepID=UPI003D9AF20D
MSTGKTGGSSVNHSPISHLVSTTKPEKPGKTVNHQSVTKVEPDNNIPRDRLYRSGVPLKQRPVAEVKVTDTPIKTFVALFLRRPKPSDIREARALAEQLAASIGEEVDPKIEFKDRRATLQRGTPEHKACLLLVESGLATVEPTSGTQTITFKLLRPHDLPRQQRVAEFLCKTVPLEVGDNGTLNWEKMLKEMEPKQSNDLQIAHVVSYVGGGKYQANHKSPRAVARFNQLQSTIPTASTQQRYWENRINQLLSIALADHQDDLIHCRQAVRRAHNTPPYILQVTAGKCRDDKEHAIAVELEKAYDDLSSNEPARPQQTLEPQATVEESPVEQEPWDKVKTVLREMGLIDQAVDLPSLSHLAEAYEKRLPFNLSNLAQTAMLMEKERELRADYDVLGMLKGTKLTEEKLQKLEARLDEMDFDRTANAFNEGSEWSTSAKDQREFRDAYQFVKRVYDELKASNPRPSIEQMAEKLLDLESIPRLQYSERQWQVAHRILMEGE